MKQNVRYRVLTIPGKLRLEVTLAVDERRQLEYVSTREGTQTTILQLYPYIGISIIRPSERDENGNFVRPPWNPNDNLSMTKFNFPIFREELKAIHRDLQIPELYTYQGKRLELNEEIAAKIRRVFMIGNMTLELSAVVVVNDADDSRVEGIKLKFNNEQSSVVLTLNELTALLYSVDHMEIDTLCNWMFTTYLKSGTHPNTITLPAPNVDILPKE